jgi:glycosyltransferase involved in cell wall biosynthesis
VASIVGQTYGDFEIVVIDDGSTDSTPAFLDSFADRDPRARVIHTPNRGIISALNTGIGECRGELIARMDVTTYPTLDAWRCRLS